MSKIIRRKGSLFVGKKRPKALPVTALAILMMVATTYVFRATTQTFMLASILNFVALH